MKPLYAKLLRRNKFLAQRAIALVLGLEYTLLSCRCTQCDKCIVAYLSTSAMARCAKGTFGSVSATEHEVFDRPDQGLKPSVPQRGGTYEVSLRCTTKVCQDLELSLLVIVSVALSNRRF